MQIFEWKPSLEVGVTEIDADHRVLVQLLGRIQMACDRNDRAEALTVLEELEHYTEHHFALEERLMDEYDYEFSEFHREEHHKLFDEVRQQTEDLVTGRATPGTIAQFMQRWLLRHIAGADKHLGESIARSRQAVAS